MPKPNAADKTGPVEQELIESTGIKLKPNEKRHAFLKRLNAAVNNAYDADPNHVAWENLSQAAQQWVNDGNATKGDIPDFDSEETPEDELETQQEESEETMPITKPTKKSAATKKAPAATKPAAAKAAAPKVNGEKKPGKFDTIIRTALKHPKKSGEELADMLPDFSRASVVTVRSDLKRTLRVLTDVGLVKDNPF